MARPRKPTDVLKFKGAFDKNPKREKARAGEPRPVGEVGDPPETLTVFEQNIWREIAAEAFWLRSPDRRTLAHACMLAAQVDARTTDMNVHRLYDTKLSKLGLDPTSRSKISVPGSQAKPKARFGELAG